MGKKNKLMMYQNGGTQMQQPTGMMMPHQSGGLIPFQHNGSGGVFSNIADNLRLKVQVAISEKKHMIMQQTADAYSLSLRMAEEHVLAPYKIAHAIGIMKHDLKDRKEYRRIAKATRFKVEAETEQIKAGTVGTELDNKLKEVKVATALMELELLKWEFDFKKKNMGEG